MGRFTPGIQQGFQKQQKDDKGLAKSKRLDFLEMKTIFDINDLLESGSIGDELDYERALIFDRKLRVLSKENPELKLVRKKLRDLIEKYETTHWSSDHPSGKRLRENEAANRIAELERLFIHNRKNLIRKKLKSLGLNQQDLGLILGHPSKSYMSELMNGICPFTLRDLVVIHRLLKIDLSDLVPTFLSTQERLQIDTSVARLQQIRK